MRYNPYSTYRGRKNWLRRILIAIVVLLTVALIAALIGAFVLPSYMEYTPEGTRLVIPFFRGEQPSPTPGAVDGPSVVPEPSADDIIFDDPSLPPTPSVQPTPPPEMLPRRDTPLGLLSYEFPRLIDGSARESLSTNRGAIFDIADADLTDPDIQTAILDLPYAVAVVEWDGDTDLLVTLAGLGFDEILLTGTDVSLTDASRVTLDDLGYQGRLSVVAEEAPFLNDTSLGRLYARLFDRVYVPGGGWGSFSLYKYLKDNGFRGSTSDIVTLVNRPVSAGYSWAVLPQ